MNNIIKFLTQLGKNPTKNPEPNTITREKNIDSLNVIARKLGKKTRPENLYDPQVQRNKLDWRESITKHPDLSDTFSRMFSYKKEKFHITLRVNDEYLAADIKGPFGDSVICSFNNKLKYSKQELLLSEAINKKYGCEIYVDCGPSYIRTVSFLMESSFGELIKSLNLSKKEHLIIRDGEAYIYLQRFTSEEVLESLEILLTILSRIPPPVDEAPDFSDMPEKFVRLIPLINQWAIQDDFARSEKIARASSKRLFHLVESLRSEFTAINQYLDSFNNQPLPEHAILLGRVAECASEAQIRLTARDAKKSLD